MKIKWLRSMVVATASVAWFGLLFLDPPVEAQTTSPSASSGSAGSAPAPVGDRDADQGLESAYKKEFAFLEAQRRQLEEHLTRFETTAQRENAELRNEIERLEKGLLDLDGRSGRMEEELREAELAVEGNADNKDILDATFDQAGSTFKKYGDQGIDAEALKGLDDEARIGKLFGRAKEVVGLLSGIRKTQGTFYLLDGAKTEGTLIQVGNVAAYGVSDKGSGVLAPAGGGEYKLWPQPAADVAGDLAAGRPPESLKIFLYESLDRQIASDSEKTLIGHIRSGGSIAWIIVGIGGLAILLIILRAFFLRGAGASAEEITRTVGALVQEGRMDAALEACRRRQSATGRVVAATIRNLDRDREHLEDIISESILHESGHLNRFGAFIMVLAAVSPLLGLLGTVTGMISTFDVITEFGTGDPKLLSGGIAVALITTELGLVVAIPTLVLGHMLSGWGERIKGDMEKAALRIMNLHQSTRSIQRETGVGQELPTG